MDFEWDEAKRTINLVKHGIDFNKAKSIWSYLVLDPADARLHGSEMRYAAVGVVADENVIITVIYTMRGNRRRIISARRARRYERANYQSFVERSRR